METEKRNGFDDRGHTGLVRRGLTRRLRPPPPDADTTVHHDGDGHRAQLLFPLIRRDGTPAHKTRALSNVGARRTITAGGSVTGISAAGAAISSDKINI